MNLGHFGTFDVENFGDLLFPLLVQRRLAQALPEWQVHPVSPVGGRVHGRDCLCSLGVEDLLQPHAPALDAVLIGGGNIIHTQPTKVAPYGGTLASLVGYADLWIGAARLAAPHAPILWNAPGVSEPFPKPLLPLVRDTLARSAYISVRDAASRDYFLEVVPDAEIAVVPDPAWEIARYWSASDLVRAAADCFARMGRPQPERSVVFHLNRRYFQDREPQAIAAILDPIARKLEAVPVLLAIGPCHGDGETANAVAAAMATPAVVVSQPDSLLEVAALLSQAVAYVGSSMHGLIVATAFGVPAVCIAKLDKVKFQGLQQLLGRDELIIEDWAAAWEVLLPGMAPAIRAQVAQGALRAQQAVDQHWVRLIQHLMAAAERAPDPRPAHVSPEAVTELLRARMMVLAQLAEGYLEESQLRRKAERRIGRLTAC